MKDSNVKKKDYKICDELKYDVRLINRNLEYNFISEADLKSHIQSLKDETANAAESDFADEGSAEGKGLTFLSA